MFVYEDKHSKMLFTDALFDIHGDIVHFDIVRFDIVRCDIVLERAFDAVLPIEFGRS